MNSDPGNTFIVPKWEPKYEDMFKNIDLMEGYESPIQKIVHNIADEITQRENDYLVECVHKVGFNIDEKELKRALQYDRDSYAKGVEYGIKLGRKQIAKEFFSIIFNVCDDMGYDIYEKARYYTEKRRFRRRCRK